MAPQCNTQQISFCKRRLVSHRSFNPVPLSCSGIIWPKVFLGLSRQTLTLKLLCRNRIWTTCDWFKGWAPRLCLFRLGQLKSLTIQVPLNNGLRNSTEFLPVLPKIYHPLYIMNCFFSLFYFYDTNFIPWINTLFHHSFKK